MTRRSILATAVAAAASVIGRPFKRHPAQCAAVVHPAIDGFDGEPLDTTSSGQCAELLRGLDDECVRVVDHEMMENFRGRIERLRPTV